MRSDPGRGSNTKHRFRKFGAIWVVLGAAVLGGGTPKPSMASQAELQAEFMSREKQLRKSEFHRPIVLLSVESEDRLTGDIFAEMAYPLSVVSSHLSRAEHWCDVMILHVNTKYCRAVAGGPASEDKPVAKVLKVNMGKKIPEQLSSATEIDFGFDVVTHTRSYFEVALSAKDGPLGTSDYRLRLQAIAASPTKTFLQLTYSYSANVLARLAMRAYLGTAGRGKVGFTTAGIGPDGQPIYIDGMRALVERNAMRYYLAIDSYLQSAEAPAASQSEQRLQAWYTATQQYPRQLHDVERPDYLTMKRAEVLRQEASP